MTGRKTGFLGIGIICLTLIISIVYLGQTLANKTSAEGTAENKLTISTSFYPIYIMALNITEGVPGVELVNIAPPETGCLHNVQLSAADLKILDRSDIFLVNGAGMEGYLEKTLTGFPNLILIDASKNLDANSIMPQVYPSGNDTNPHFWVSIQLAIEQVKEIGEQLALFDRNNSRLYLRNTEEYVKKLENLKQKIHEGLKDIKYRNMITYHDSFHYFAREFNLNILAVIQRTPGSEPSARELADICAVVRNMQAKIIFTEPQYSGSAVQTIVRETGAKIYTLDPASTGPLEKDAYIDIMEKNLHTLQEALWE